MPLDGDLSVCHQVTRQRKAPLISIIQYGLRAGTAGKHAHFCYPRFHFFILFYLILHSRTSKTVSPPYSENSLEHRPGIRWHAV